MINEKYGILGNKELNCKNVPENNNKFVGINTLAGNTFQQQHVVPHHDKVLQEILTF